MASVKLATLIIRTLAKPISMRIKEQARQHPRFREFCVDLAQFMYRSEIKLRTNVLGEAVQVHVRPLSEARAIDQGANFIAEGFMFSVAVGLILGETWRSSRSQSKRRDSIDDQLDDLGTGLSELRTRVSTLADKWGVQLQEEKQRNDELSRILERVVEIGLRGGWAEFQDTPLQLPRVQLAPHLRHRTPNPSSSSSPEESEPPLETIEEHSISDLSPQDTQIVVSSTDTPESSDSDSDPTKPKPPPPS